MTNPDKITVAMYRDVLLPTSEPFIKAMAENLVGFDYLYVGLRRVPGLNLPTDRIRLIEGGSRLPRVEHAAFKLMGHIPPHIRDLGVSIVHAHFGWGGTAALPLAAHHRVPLLTSFYGSDITVRESELMRGGPKSMLYALRRRALAREGTRFIAISNSLRMKMVDAGFPDERITVHHNGVDTGFFTPDQSIIREPIVLFVGRLIENKGAEFLIRAMQQAQVDTACRAVIIGEGPERPELERLARDLGVRADFLGTQPHAVIKDWMNRSSVMAVPSVEIESGASEGLPLVVVEAQSMELPVVAFDTGGISEAIDHDRTGLIVAQRDWRALTRALAFFLGHPEVSARFGRCGRERAIDQFDLAKQTAGLERIYASLLPGTSR